MFSVIVAAIIRKLQVILDEVLKLSKVAKADVIAVEQKAKAEAKKIREELIDAISKL